MSFKNALADIPMGGGKSVLLCPRDARPSPAQFAAFGQAVDALQGRYVTAVDVGTRVADMQVVARYTRHVSGCVVGGDDVRRAWRVQCTRVGGTVGTCQRSAE